MISVFTSREVAGSIPGTSTILTLSDLNLFKAIKKRNLKHNQTSEKQIDMSLIFFPLNNRSCQYQKHLNSIGKDSNYDLITPNGKISHFIVYIEVEELGS